MEGGRDSRPSSTSTGLYGAASGSGGCIIPGPGLRLHEGSPDAGMGKLPIPTPPTAPKPSNMIPASLRHKFVNHSVSSLPTNCATRDNLAEEDDDDDDEEPGDGNDSSSESGMDSESDLGDCEDTAGGAGIGVQKTPTGHAAGALTAGRLAALQEEDSIHLLDSVSSESRSVCISDLEDDEEDVSSEAAPSELSERCLDDVEEFDECADWPDKKPLLNLEAGIRPPWELPRCPPAAWLTAAGFDVAGGTTGFDAAPVAPVCGERPKQYLNLFCRQMLARQQSSDLTVGSLALHDVAVGKIRHTESMQYLRNRQSDKCSVSDLAERGDWLQAFIARARAEPLRDAAESIVGSDLKENVADFLDSLSDVSDVNASMDDQDIPNGVHVSGQKMSVRPVHRGRGRMGWCIENDAAISTPGRSQSPPPRREPPPLPVEAPTPPLIPPPGQERRQRSQPRRDW